jgi:hypothetical protein
MARHAPAHRRDIVRRLKAGEEPRDLLAEARTIQSPGHAAAAMLHIAQRVDGAKAAAIMDEARKMVDLEGRPSHMAEAWRDCLGLLPQGKRLEKAREAFQDNAITAIEEMPNGAWVRDALAAIAPLVDHGHDRMLRRAWNNPGFEIASSKAVLSSVDSKIYTNFIQAEAPKEIVPYLLRGDEAWQQTLTIEDVPKRHEALRVLIWAETEPEVLAHMIDATPNVIDRVRVLYQIGAREDRLKIGAPAERFAAAAALMDQLPDEVRAKETKKLAQAVERAGLAMDDLPTARDVESSAASADEPGDAVDSPPAEPSPDAASADPIATVEPTDQTDGNEPGQGPDGRKRHTLCIVDSYAGGLGPTHLRAISRAAPLAVAFDLNLCLAGFPTDDLEKLTDLVERDTNVGEGAGYARQLLDAGRLSLMVLDAGVPASWPGKPIATTPHPDADKLVPLQADGEICLLVGLGKQGLPKRMLNAVGAHHELTGAGISLETATAMGILADRLGQRPL